MNSFLFHADADDDDRDVERKRKPSHLGGKEILMIALVIAALFTIIYIVFIRPGIERAWKVRSQDNVREIYGALMLYAADNSEGLPAVYLPRETDAEGNPITWANQLFGYAPHDVFRSPAARPEWGTLLTNTTRERGRVTVSLSYGMIADADTRRVYELRDDTRLLLETIGGGQAGSLNPLPIPGFENRDGFMIGYNDSNRSPTPETEHVTRVAFLMRGEVLAPLHADGVVGIRADGRLLILTSPEQLSVVKRGNLPVGPWVVH